MVDKQTWMRFSLAQQLSHIGSELSRARHWEEENDRVNRDKALGRALELLDLSLRDSRWKLRLKELARLREAIGDWLRDHKNYDIPSKALEEYCTAFALMHQRVSHPS